MKSSNEALSPEALSALVDGESQPAALASLCASWHADGNARAQWHAYHLIGDVLRSDDLASTSAHDLRFLEAVRARLASEPVVLAPLPAIPIIDDIARPGQQRAATRWWAAPSAMAAGFVLVAGGLLAARLRLPAAPAAPQVAQASYAPAAIGLQRVSTQAGAAIVEPQVLVANSKLIRDAQLDRYLDAHHQFAGSSALGVPSGFLRNAAVEAPR